MPSKNARTEIHGNTFWYEFIDGRLQISMSDFRLPDLVEQMSNNSKEKISIRFTPDIPRKKCCPFLQE